MDQAATMGSTIGNRSGLGNILPTRQTWQPAAERRKNILSDIPGRAIEAQSGGAERIRQAAQSIKPHGGVVKFPETAKDHRWEPTDKERYERQVQSWPFEKDTFLSLPWAILCNKRFGPTLEARGLLSVLAWTADGSGISRLTDREIEAKRGPRPDRGRRGKNKTQPNTPIRILNNLEMLGLIAISNRQGKNRAIEVDKTAIEICKSCQSRKMGQLIVPPAVFLLNLTTPQKIILTARLTFQNMGAAKMARRLGLSQIRIKAAHLDLIDYKGVLVKLEGQELIRFINDCPQPLIKQFLTLNKAKYRYILGIDINHYLFLFHRNSFMIDSGPTDRDLSGNPSYKGNETTPPLNDNNNPLLENDMKTGQKTSTTQEDIDRYNRREALEQKAKAIRPKSPRRKKTFSPPKNGYDRRHELDMEWIKNNCPLIHIPAPGTRSYHEDIRVVDVLERSPNAVMTPDEIRALLGGMDGKVLQGDRDPLTKEYISKWFLPARMDQEERRRLYKDVSDSLSREYGGRGEKMRLSQALLSHRGWSRILQCWLKAPRKARDQMPDDWREYEVEYYAALELVDGHPSHARVAELAHNIRATRKRWREDWRGKAPEGYDGRAYLLWGTFFKELVDYFDQQPRRIHVGWFKPDSDPMNDFLAEVGFRGFRARSRPGGYNRDEREELYV